MISDLPGNIVKRKWHTW